MKHTITLPEWHPDCGGDWVLSGPGFFANYWPDNTVVASILDGEDGREIASSGIVHQGSRAECMAYAEWWIKAELNALPAGLCGNREDHAPHRHESTSLGTFWCHADQTKRLPYAMERKPLERACDHRQCPADVCQGC